MASEPRYVKLPQLFSGTLFRVPDYQRGYAWTKLQLDDLWSDVHLLDDSTEHFTGMIVVEGREKRVNEQDLQDYEVLEIIDGQQRMTSLVILLQALARELDLVGTPEAAKQAQLIRDRYVGTTGWFRLALNEDSRGYFEHLLVEGEPLEHTENGSQRNLLEAVRYFRARLAERPLEAEPRYAELTTLVRRLQSNLRFVYYQVDDDAEAGLIFEVMNNRGKPLSEADRLKNYLMYLAHKVGMSPEAVKSVAGQWGDFFKQVMRAAPTGSPSPEDEARLLRSHWILYKEASAPQKLRGLSISQRVKHELALSPVADESQAKERNLDLGREITSYTQSLVRSAHDYAELLNPSAPKVLSWIRDGGQRERVRHHLLSFHWMDRVAPFVPLLLAGRRRLQDQPDLFERLVASLSVFAFRVYGMCNVRSYTAQPHFRRLAHRLFAAEGSKLVETAEEVIGSVQHWTRELAPDDALERALHHHNFYDAQMVHEIRHLFYEYEREICHGQVPALDWTTFADSKKTQIEHIWPQNREAYLLGGSEETHKQNVNRLGNLTVSHLNQTLSNREFADKKPIYAKSSLLIENQLQHYPNWNLDVIQKREDEIVAFLLKRWRIEP